MLIKRFNSLALCLGIFGSVVYQGASCLQGSLQEKSVVDCIANKENLKVIEGGTVDPKKVKTEETDGVDKSNKSAVGEYKGTQKKEIKILFLDERSDLFINWLSKKFGFHEFWKSLFRTYAGDPYKFAKMGFVAILAARLLLTLLLSFFLSIRLLKKFMDRSYTLYDVIFQFISLALRFVSPATSVVFFKFDVDNTKEIIRLSFSKSDTCEENFDNKSISEESN